MVTIITICFPRQYISFYFTLILSLSTGGNVSDHPRVCDRKLSQVSGRDVSLQLCDTHQLSGTAGNLLKTCRYEKDRADYSKEKAEDWFGQGILEICICLNYYI